MRAARLLGLVASLVLVGCQDGPKAAAGPEGSPASWGLLQAAKGGDGDSWRDTSGVEYRLGLVNTPELSECYGSAASNKRKQLTAAGFRADSYAVDNFGRRVSVVYLADGRNLNVWLARNGYADDRYLNQFRRENRTLAAELDLAFAAAKRAQLGVWGACPPS